MANVKTQQRIDIELSLEDTEARALLQHLEETTDENSDNNVLSIHQALSNAINGKPRKERGEGAGRPGRKPMTEEEKAAAKKAKEEKAAAAAQAAASQTPDAAPSAPSAAAATSQVKKAVASAFVASQPAAASKTKVTVPA